MSIRSDKAGGEGYHGKTPDQSDVDRMFEDFMPMQEACLSDYSTLIPCTTW